MEKYLCEEGKKGSLYDAYPFGIALVEFMEERGLISLTTNLKDSVRVRNKANYYLPKSLFVLNNFDLSLLPMKLNLPMICPPVLWDCSKNTGAPITFSDLTGGYLNALTGEIYDRYSLMSSKNPKHFYIEFTSQSSCLKVCTVMNKLQVQPFKINCWWLYLLLERRDVFVENGLLAPPLLASINLKKAAPMLRELHMKNEKINKLVSYTDLLRNLSKLIQRANYERFILRLAEAYAGYSFYLPAFADFRGPLWNVTFP